MRRLSSRATFFLKRVFPVLWVAFLVFLVAVLARSPKTREDVPAGFVVIPAAMAIVGFVLFRILLFDLVDEVWDADDRLIVRNGGEEEHVPLREIINVSYTLWMNPPRVTLLLRHPGRFGREISFAAPNRLIPYSRSAQIDELIERIDAARRE